jgi:hypothetical protein
VLVNGNVGVAVGVGRSRSIRVGVGRTDGVATAENATVGGHRVAEAAVGEGVAITEVAGGNGFKDDCGLIAMMMNPKISPPVATSVKTVNITGSRPASASLRLLSLHHST